MKKQSPIGRILELGEKERGKLALSVILAVVGVVCGMVPYYAAAKKSRAAGSCKFTKAKTEKTPRKQKRFRGVLLSILGLIVRLLICNNCRNRQERR